MTDVTPLSKQPHLSETITIDIYRYDDKRIAWAEWAVTGADYFRERPAGHGARWSNAIPHLTLTMQRLENHYARQRRMNGGQS